MFIMMNAARLGVGLQGLAQGEVAYQNAVALREGPPPGPRADRRRGARADAKADPIIVHPDVRRMLMEAKAFNEARARARPVGRAPGRSRPHRRRPRRSARRPNDLLALLTPVIKGYLHRQGLSRSRSTRSRSMAATAISANGAWSSSSAMPASPMIYEGTNGIQALDLVGRKLGAEWRPRDPGLLQAASARKSAAAKDDEAAAPIADRAREARWRPPDRDHVADAERPGQSRQCRRGGATAT